MKELTLVAPINKLSYGRVSVNLLIQLQKLGVKVNLVHIGEIEIEGKEKGVVEWALNNSKTLDTEADILKIWHAHDMQVPEQLTGRLFGFPIFELDSFSQQEKDELSKVKIINCTKWATTICNQNGITNTAGVVNLGVDLDIFKPVECNKDPLFKVLNVGKMEIRKGHDIIPDIFSLAFKKIGIDKVMLTMCWDNPFYTQGEKDSWINYYKKERLNGFNLNFMPRLESQRDVAALMQQSDVGLFPSRAEGWNLDMLEMMACEKPVVATNYSGHTEFINPSLSIITPNELEPAIDGKWFFGQGRWAKISDKNIKDMAKLLRFYYDEWQKNISITSPSNLKIAQRFTWENSAKQLMEILK